VAEVERDCEACEVNEYRYGFTFGFDSAGPWGTLACSSDGCEAHQAVRPVFETEPAYTDVQLMEALLDFATDDGWRIDHGAWCSQHA
jgi:hypothetical protein